MGDWPVRRCLCWIECSDGMYTVCNVNNGVSETDGGKEIPVCKIDLWRHTLRVTKVNLGMCKPTPGVVALCKCYLAIEKLKTSDLETA